jgi:hypothetical protein
VSCRLRTSCVLRWGRARTTVSSCWLKRKDEIMHTYRLPRQARHSQESETTECMLLNASHGGVQGATHGCGDGGYQSDWSQTYSALLCHRFGAACSTIAVGGKCVMHE